jgi:hypothetical protein
MKLMYWLPLSVLERAYVRTEGLKGFERGELESDPNW